MEGADGFLDIRALSQNPEVAQVVQPSLSILVIRLELVLERSGENAQLIAQPDVVTGQVAGRRRQIVSCHRRQAILTPPFRSQRRSPGVPLEFEPEN